MELEDYFQSINLEKHMIKKDTTVSLSIQQDNSDLDDFPNTYINASWEYSDATWVQILEDIIKVLETQYGYDIKSKVYYVTKTPIFDHNYSSAPGRELDYETFMDVLEKYPGLNNGGEHDPILW